MAESVSFQRFPLQLATTAVLLTCGLGLLAQVPPLVLVIRSLIAMLVFLILGQFLKTLWEWLNPPTPTTEQALHEPADPSDQPPQSPIPVSEGPQKTALPASPSVLTTAPKPVSLQTTPHRTAAN